MNLSIRSSRRLTVVAIVAVCSLLAGVYYTIVLEPYIREHRIVQRLEKRGVRMHFLGSDVNSGNIWEQGARRILGVEVVESPVAMYFENVVFKDDDLRDVGQVYRVWDLYLKNQPITDQGLSHLSKLNMLRLDLSGTKVGSGNCRNPKSNENKATSGFESLSNSTRLNNLVVSRTNFNDNDLAAVLKWSTPSLLYLNETCVTDVGMGYLTTHPDLRWIRLDDTAVTPSGLKQINARFLESLSIKGMKLRKADAPILGTFLNLDELDLSRTGFTSHDCAHLSKLTKLTQLYLKGNQIDDEGLKSLAANPTIQALDLRNNPITMKGLDAFSDHTQLSKLGIDGDLLADPMSITQLQKLTFLTRIIYTRSIQATAVMDQVKQELGSKIELVESVEH